MPFFRPCRAYRRLPQHRHAGCRGGCGGQGAAMLGRHASGEARQIAAAASLPSARLPPMMLRVYAATPQLPFDDIVDAMLFITRVRCY